jgi:sigma-B regulation protein RsbU (phosphoserine phosphatase)
MRLPAAVSLRYAGRRARAPILIAARLRLLEASLSSHLAESVRTGPTAAELSRLLGVTRALAAPFDLSTMLAAVAAAACEVLHAERCSVWLHDAAARELVLEIASDLRAVRIPLGTGLVGACARDRAVLNVPDCYADPRFNPETDRRSGFRTRCSLTLPLVDHRQALVGVMQVLNRHDGIFDAADEALATALAAQCAVALQRVQAVAALVEAEKLRGEMQLARDVQRSTLPAEMPALAGYAVHGLFAPADLTGGDTFDLARVGDGLLVVLADATGHGLAPALSVTQMHAMLRIALDLGTPLEEAVRAVNNRLAATLASDRFITAFVGLLDPSAHLLRYVSAGQAPILRFDGRTGALERHGPTTFPLGAMPVTRARAPQTLEFGPGDLLLLASDGVFEARRPDGDAFGEARVEALVREHHHAPVEQIAKRLCAAVAAFAEGLPQEDDVSLVLVRREAAA